ncbi:M23 family metallopeptidase [Ferruginibacter yonginensis]|uniref:M23 family metallopeptidase n=1 Tax=Ferruginibacter yonginensis TaxID=1310416 RepID=A0ABV8QRD8_9BACT
MQQNRFHLLIIALLTTLGLNAQIFSPKKYPQQYFQWPVDAAVGIVANFGELRPNHYHMGLDCRTDQVENKPVYAAAAGYIAKVKIEPFGFGRCIYINHPNGLTTLYAHLNAFEPALENYVTTQQYLLQRWDVFLDIPAKLFPVKAGDYIANSGNTGGSQGPHVHFEIRDTKTDKVLNPLLFGFNIPDNVPPTIVRLAMYDRTKSTYDQSPQYVAIKKVGTHYEPVNATIVAPSNYISFGISAVDKVTGSANPNGIYGAAVMDNNQLLSSFEMDSISYDETRYLNAHIDYKTRSSGGPFIQHLSALPGYYNGIYKSYKNFGVTVMNNEPHAIAIVVADAALNTDTLYFTVQPPMPNAVKAPYNFNYTQKMIPGFINVFERNNLRFYLPENALYDTVNFVYKETPVANGATVYQLHNATVPVQCYYSISILDDVALTDTGKMMMKTVYGSKTDFKKANFSKGGWFTAAFRNFGTFQLVKDTLPPSLTPIGFKDGMKASSLKRLLFSVVDNTEEIGSFNAWLDGNWLRFSNDKGRNFIYVFDEKCAPGAHTLMIKVADLCGNTTTKTFAFTR